jgi:tRNA dimethylallyltransferase
VRKIVVIVGPTGSGKTSLAIHLAQQFNAEIINADSRQVYREMDIGTAKPTSQEREKIPHHLIDVCAINEPWNAALFVAKADEAFHDIESRGKVAFFVGGTGLHIRAFLFGLFEGVEASPQMRAQFEARIEKEGLASLYSELKNVDPDAATKITSNDPTRIVRALEVFYLTGKPISAHQAQHGFQKARYDYLKIGLTTQRDELIKALDTRVDQMIEVGLEDEVRKLFEKWGEHPLLQRAIGYAEWYPYLRGEISKKEVVERIKISTRQFAKRQMTWFRKEKDIVWTDPSHRSQIQERIARYLKF